MALFTTQLARAKKELFSSLLKKKERKTPHHRLIYIQRVKKRNKSEKDMVSTVLLHLAIASIFFRRCKKLKTSRQDV